MRALMTGPLTHTIPPQVVTGPPEPPAPWWWGSEDDAHDGNVQAMLALKQRPRKK